MIWFLVLVIIVGVLLLGHYGLPEKINPEEFQETPPASKLMQGAEPYILKGESDTAFLLVHGFEGSPYTLRGIGETLHRQGHTVIAPLLPGHGTSVADFAKTRYEHWYYALQQLYLEHRPKHNKFFIIGFSMGGNLSMRLTIHYSHRLPPTGLVCISSPVIINGFANGKIVFQDWRMLFSGIFKLLTKYVPKKNQVLASAMISPWVGYSEAYSVGPLHSLKLNIGKIRPHLKYIRCPVCLIQATNDSTISSENLHLIYRKVTSREKRAFQFTIDENVSTRHVLITHDHIRDRVYHYILEFIKDTLANFDFPRDKEPDPGFWKKVFMKSKKLKNSVAHLIIFSLGIVLVSSCARFKVDNLSDSVEFATTIGKNGLRFPEQSGIIHGVPKTVGVSSERIIISEPDEKTIKIFRDNTLVTRLISKDREKDESVAPAKPGIKRLFSEQIKVPGNVIAGNDDDFYVLNYYPNLKGTSEEGGFYKVLNFDLNGKYIRTIGRKGQPEIPFENILWMDTDTSGRLWVSYRHLDELHLEGYEEGRIFRELNDADCRATLFDAEQTDKKLVERCEFMYPFPSGEKILLVGRVDTIQSRQGDSNARVFQFRKFVVSEPEKPVQVIFSQMNDPEDFPYLPYNENEILIWQTLEHNRVKLAIYNLNGTLINNLQITQKGRFENWRSTWYTLTGELYSLKIGSKNFEVISWK